MFPLGAVLFPHVVLPLHVFEPRYRQLTRDCLAGDREFGVVLIERGHEVGGGDSRFPEGTVAHILEAAEFDDGRWALVTVGTRRIRVCEWLPDAPYPQALVEDAPDVPMDPAATGDDDLRAAERAVRRAIALKIELDEPVGAPHGFELAVDPTVAGWQLAAVAPFGPVDQLRILREDDPVARLQLVASMAEDEADVLAYRLSSG
jgi:Lon protease-like protein